MLKNASPLRTLTPFALLVIILFLGALSRLILGFQNIPYFSHYDEPQTVSTALFMIKQGSLNPEFF
ncbi:MAG: hypothetical protein OXE99_08560, partial [Cellvibrionales bacterium]|nr:hypothetical protein [Cellvibrionales bacterium]